MQRLRNYRLSRVREQLRASDYSAILLFNPINMRYATGTRNMTQWLMHDQERYLFIPLEGPVVLFEYGSAMHLAKHLETINEIRLSTPWYYFGAAQKAPTRAKKWAAEIADLMQQYGGANRRLALDQCDYLGVDALRSHNIEVQTGQDLMEQARSIKSSDELTCMNIAISVAETGMARMQESLKPGITENQIWAQLHETNIAMGGEWIETRLLASRWSY